MMHRLVIIAISIGLATASVAFLMHFYSVTFRYHAMPGTSVLYFDSYTGTIHKAKIAADP